MAGLGELEKALAYTFSDQQLLSRALTHASLSREESNQRLEFLGDAVLQLCISAQLFSQKRKDDEGSLTRRRQQIVREAALHEVAGHLNLGAYIRMQPELARAGGRQSASLLADTMEAVIGAVYLDGGMDEACGLVNRLWGQLIRETDTALDAKGALQAHLQGQGLPQPDYELTGQMGPPHQRTFETAVYASGRELARAWGSTIKAAQQQAAEKALETLKKEEAER
ncbi:MAG: ribonuclease III [Eubacteriales bacterium]|nr:ribonuclease III [Eubacteriales bacterium]